MERTQHSRSCGIGQDTLQGKNTGAAEKRDRENRKVAKLGGTHWINSTPHKSNCYM